MITPDYVKTMARYGAWRNEQLIESAGALTDAARREARGAFFGSIFATFNHLLWGDMMWMRRFSGTPAPSAQGFEGSKCLHADWDAFIAARRAFDATIGDWAGGVEQSWLSGDLHFHSTALGRETSAPAGLCVTHFFNHATHHRGQIHAMLTAAGGAPGVTDLFLMPAAAAS